ncbi:hypothetical protein BDV96DRAFT_651084 [Lophiotrema nucula]|uniref:Uncharacterized protein n=1 Tax=Lophiotrema nucula TaxID=690887 RepID=A0A6A5YTW2_9PLEO|nr:hypothetical protein BDV96DRAFT_651084 [Lophiotrema nucula]
MSEDTKFSAREMEVLALCWQCFDGEPKINYDKLADLTGYTIGSAKTTVGNLKRKLNRITSSANANPTPGKGAGTPKTPRKRATKPADNDESPTKKRRTPAKKAAAAQQDDEEEYSVFKIKKEEVGELNNGADAFYNQTASYATGDYPEETEDGI